MNCRLLVLAVILAGCAAVPAATEQRQRGPARELVGRSAGPPRSCVTLTPSQSLRISDNDRHTLLYGGGRTIWANHLGRCSFPSDDVLITEPTGSQLCRGDLVKSVDRTSGIQGPAC